MVCSRAISTGFFGLFFSGFPDLLLIASLTPLCGLPQQLVTGRILPAVAFSILLRQSVLCLAGAPSSPRVSEPQAM